MTSSSTCSITKIHDCYIRASVYKDDGSEISRDPRTKTPQNWARMTHYGFQITSNSLPSYTYAPRLSTCPQFPTREVALTRFRVIVIILQTRYLLTGSSRSVDFFTERLQFRRMCARMSRDRFFLVASHYGRCLSSSSVVTEQRHLLLTQHQ